MLRLSWKNVCHPAALYLAVLFSTTLVDSQSTCDSDAPDNCTFARGLSLCKWQFNVNGWYYDRSSAVFGTAGLSEANVTSRTACSTGRDTHCLQVRYLFEVNDIGMRVKLIPVRNEDNGDDSLVLVAWNGTDAGIGVWHNASIPIQINVNFNIAVEAKKCTQGPGKIFIDYIHYIKAPCSAYETSTVPSPATRTQEERSTTIGSHVSTIGSHVSTIGLHVSTIGSHVSTIGSHVSTDASNDVGVVVGVVVAVIVIAVAVVFFVLYRQQRLHLWRTCFRNSKRTDSALTRRPQNTEAAVANDDTAFSTGANAASGNGNESLYLTPISHEYRKNYVNQHVDQTPTSHEDTGTPTGSNTTPRDTNYVNQQLYTTPGARSPDNDYSVLGNTAGSNAALPSNPYVNQTIRADNQNSRESVGRSSDDPYEIV